MYNDAPMFTDKERIDKFIKELANISQGYGIEICGINMHLLPLKETDKSLIYKKLQVQFGKMTNVQQVQNES